MFRKVTRKIAKQMDPKGDLVPVHSISDQHHFRLLCLVRRKRKTRFHPFPCYRRTEYTLQDVLLPGKDTDSLELLLPSRDSQGPKEFTTTGRVHDGLDGTLSVPIHFTELELGAAASMSKQWHLKVEEKHILVPKLEALSAERRIDTKHAFIEQLRKAGQNLYVVHQMLETSEEARYEECMEGEARFMARLYAKFSAKGTADSKQSITIPRGCTVAFGVKQLTIGDTTWGINHLPENDQPTFESDSSAHRELYALEKEVKQNCDILSQLADELNIIVVKSIRAVMRDRNLLEELAGKMETALDEPESCELTAQSPDLEDLLCTLQFSPRHHLLHLTGAISYTLDAFSELTEDQLLLLLESWEVKIVPQQLKLVRSILEQSTEHGEQCCSTAASWTSFREQEQQLTTAVLRMSGVELQGSRAAAFKEENFPSLAALYAALYALHCLSTSG
ncbi:gasdermin-A [Cyrtonyx montezumae]|uniref:gasdermin-A n=1 Tax=Cyrtonyx montezumae TaxID=9017 RepID=UPI0032DB8575